MIAIFLMVSTSSTTKQSLGKIEQRAPAAKVDVHLYNFFRISRRQQNTKGWPQRCVKYFVCLLFGLRQFDDACIRFDTIPECDGQTDGQTCHNSIALCMHRHADVR